MALADGDCLRKGNDTVQLENPFSGYARIEVSKIGDGTDNSFEFRIAHTGKHSLVSPASQQGYFNLLASNCKAYCDILTFKMKPTK